MKNHRTFHRLTPKFFFYFLFLLFSLFLFQCKNSFTENEEIYLEENLPKGTIPINVARKLVSNTSTKPSSSRVSENLQSVYNLFKKRIKTISSLNEGIIPSLYFINYEGGGFVILSAEQKMIPILAYSENGSIDEKILILGFSCG